MRRRIIPAVAHIPLRKLPKAGMRIRRGVMDKFSAKEDAFLRSNEVCRLAMVSKEGRPQVTPVVYALDGNAFVIAVDYGIKKLKNVKENQKRRAGGRQAPPNEGGGRRRDMHGIREGCRVPSAIGLADEQVRGIQEEPVGEGRVPNLQHDADEGGQLGLG
jgi:Pyridoxamine 5'-phosphate oxidase